MKKYNWFDENIEQLELERWHRNYIKITDFILNVMCVVSILLVIGIIVNEIMYG